MKQIGFVGFSGSGKSSLAKIAGTYGFKAVDTDAEIIRKYGSKPFDAILAGDEKSFRDIESETIASCIASDASVIAFGGGVNFNHKSFDKIREAGIKIIYLKSSFEELGKRFKERPLYLRLGLDGYKKLYKSREPLYENCADFTIDTCNKTLEEIWTEVKKLWN
ncbi:MAG: shikimate kinase [bacterium]